MTAQEALPEILHVALPKTVFRGGETISGTVTTSPNVASVELRVATYGLSMPKVGVGRFALSYVVPHLPFFWRKGYTMRLIARNTRGDYTERDIPISIR